MDDLYDASVFVGDPSRSGSGPGGTFVLSAARLTGKGTMNICGMLELGTFFASIELHIIFLEHQMMS